MLWHSKNSRVLKISPNLRASCKGVLSWKVMSCWLLRSSGLRHLGLMTSWLPGWLKRLLRRIKVLLNELSPEQVSLAFLCLLQQAQPSPQLKQLKQEDWEELAHLLACLQAEKELSQVH